MLNINSPIPLYHQLKTHLLGQIQAGVLKPGDRIPSEKELGEQFRVSRTTVRQATNDLINEGLLIRVHGKGTFVAQPRIKQYLAHLTSFTQDMLSQFHKPSSRILQFEIISAPGWVAKNLQIAENASVIVLKRVRLADNQPMAIETAYLPAPSFEPLLTVDMQTASLYQTLKEKFGIFPMRALQHIEAVSCPPEEASLLNVPRKSPVLHIFRTTFDQNNRPFETVESYYRSDRYVFTVEIWSKPE